MLPPPIPTNGSVNKKRPNKSPKKAKLPDPHTMFNRDSINDKVLPRDEDPETSHIAPEPPINDPEANAFPSWRNNDNDNENADPTYQQQDIPEPENGIMDTNQNYQESNKGYQVESNDQYVNQTSTDEQGPIYQQGIVVNQNQQLFGDHQNNQVSEGDGVVTSETNTEVHVKYRWEISMNDFGEEKLVSIPFGPKDWSWQIV